MQLVSERKVNEPEASAGTTKGNSVREKDVEKIEIDLLLEGIRGKLFALPDDTVVFPGHGPATKVGHEKRFNPFVGEGEMIA